MNATRAQPEKTEKQLEIERLKAAEKFIEKETGEYECRVCSYTYKPSQVSRGSDPHAQGSTP